MNKYEYVVNTFTKTGNSLESIQLHGEIVAGSENQAIETLIEEGIIYSKGYEFLYLDKCQL